MGAYNLFVTATGYAQGDILSRMMIPSKIRLVGGDLKVLLYS